MSTKKPTKKSLVESITDPMPTMPASGSLWAGPSSNGPHGGVTYSLLSRFLVCRERFRLYAVEGVKPVHRFNHRIEYGQMWHVCEEALSHGSRSWQDELTAYCKNLCVEYRDEQEQIDKWYNVCRVQFPLYVDYWARHQDIMDRTPLLQEQVFGVPYQLPSGRTVRLRGKWDSVDLVGKGKSARIWLQENKTKGDVNEQQLLRQLSFDLQTMLYLTALSYVNDGHPGLTVLDNYADIQCNQIQGVRYNVVKRPLSGGKGTIVRHKGSKKNPEGESKRDYYTRLSAIIEADPQDYFYRWNVNVLPGDIRAFQVQCLDPILEQLCDWWKYINKGTACHVPLAPCHWRHPFGVFNILDEGGSSELDEYLATGSMAGLQRVETLFSELQ